MSDLSIIGFPNLNLRFALIAVRSGAYRGSRSVHRHVSSTDDDDLLTDVDLETLIDVQEELDGTKHAVRVVTGDIEIAAEHGTNSKEDSVVLVPQFIECHILTQTGIEMDVESKVDDGLDLRIDEVARKSVLRDTQDHHSPEPTGGLIQGHVVSLEYQVMGTRKTGRTTPDYSNTHSLAGCALWVDRAPHVGLPRLWTVLLGDETLECSNRYRLVDLTTPTCVLARSSTYTPTHRSERVREPRGEIGKPVLTVCNGGDIRSCVGVHGARGEARDVEVVEPQLGHRHLRSALVPGSIAAPRCPGRRIRPIRRRRSHLQHFETRSR